MADVIGELVRIVTSQSMAAAVGTALMFDKSREATIQYVRVAASIFAIACAIWFIDVTLISVGLVGAYLVAELGILAFFTYVWGSYQAHHNSISLLTRKID